MSSPSLISRVYMTDGSEQGRAGSSTRRSSGSLPPAHFIGTKQEQPALAVKAEPAMSPAEDDAFAALAALADEALQVSAWSGQADARC